VERRFSGTSCPDAMHSLRFRGTTSGRFEGEGAPIFSMDIPILVLHLVISKSIRGSLKVCAHLVFDVTRFAAEIAPQKIRAFAVVPALVTPLLGGHSRSTSPQIELGTINWDQERRKLRRVIRYILCDDKWLSCQPSGPAMLSHSAGICAERLAGK
jgi:hypothetical protein